MLKIYSLMIVGALAACGGAKKADTTAKDTSTDNTQQTADTAKTGDGVECSKEIAMVCPEGQIDGCLKTPAEGATHACVAK